MKITVQDLMEAGAHFGHQTSRWNPGMRPFIYGSRNGIHVVNAAMTYAQLDSAYTKVVEITSKGGQVLFVGTKPQAKEIIQAEAVRAGQPFAVSRWLGGTLTNFRTITTSVEKMNKQEAALAEPEPTGARKRELLRIRREFEKKDKLLGGIRKMPKVPAAMFVVDVVREEIAVHEATLSNVFVIGICDTNSDPSTVSLAVPGNDDAVRAIQLYAQTIADACLEGAAAWQEKLRSQEAVAKAEADKRAAQQETTTAPSEKRVIRKISKKTATALGIEDLSGE